ncbi:gypsy/ty3 retroelement polyprotein [Tanacetum coccineum]
MIVGLGAQNNQGARRLIIFLIDNTLEEEKVKIIYVYLFDKALLWNRQLIKTKGENISWTDYKDAISLRFGSVYDDPMALLKNAKYDKSAKEYQDTFDTLLSRVEVSEERAISLYLGGLPIELEMSVRMFRPKTLSDAYCLTTLQEVTLEAVKKKTDNDEEEEEYLDADESLVDIINEGVQAHISLNALFGISSFQTMRVIRLVAKQHQLHILVYSGSTHNFLDVNMAKRMGCKVWSACPLAVFVPGGKHMGVVIWYWGSNDFLLWEILNGTFKS